METAAFLLEQWRWFQGTGTLPFPEPSTDCPVFSMILQMRLMPGAAVEVSEEAAESMATSHRDPPKLWGAGAGRELREELPRGRGKGNPRPSMSAQ